MSKLGFIGTGNMGGALARAVGKSGHEVYLSDVSAEKAGCVASDIGENAHVSNNLEIITECDVVFLGVKPQLLSTLAQEITPLLSERKSHVCLVSMAAGVTLQKLGELFGSSLPIIRIMPNTPVSVGAGMILVSTNDATREGDKKLLGAALSFAGNIDYIEERLMDAASAVSGCGPAFVCLFIEALADGGVRCGLPRDKALHYAIETVKGTATLLSESGKHPGTVKDEVCSPAGSTIEGIAELENGCLRGTVTNAVTAAHDRTRELGK